MPVKRVIIITLVGLSVVLITAGMVLEGQENSSASLFTDSLNTSITDTVTNEAIIPAEQDSHAGGSAGAASDIPEHLKVLQNYEANFNIHSVLRGILGLFVLVGLGWLFSAKRKLVNWRTVLGALLLQLIIAFAVIYVPQVREVFRVMGSAFVKVLNYSEEGSRFLFGYLIGDVGVFDNTGKEVDGFQVLAGGRQMVSIFAFKILPTIIFFSALSSILYYFRVIQFVVFVFAWLMTKTLKLSGAESLSAAGNIFLGQTESPLLIKAYLEKMTKSEINLVMVGGMATVAGGVLAIYVSMLGNNNPALEAIFAQHFITASVLAAPGAVVMAKLLYPQKEKIDTSIHIPREKIGNNFLSAIANGTTDGVKLAVNVGAMLLVFIGMIALLNGILGWIGSWSNLNEMIAEVSGGQYQKFSMQFILGYAAAPLMWVVGVDPSQLTVAGQLLGEKVIINEFLAYTSMKELLVSGKLVDPKSIIIVTYILCGFANFSSIGIQVGGIGAIAPGQRKNLTKLGFRALVGGTLASLLSATIIGMLYG